MLRLQKNILSKMKNEKGRMIDAGKVALCLEPGLSLAETGKLSNE